MQQAWEPVRNPTESHKQRRHLISLTRHPKVVAHCDGAQRTSGLMWWQAIWCDYQWLSIAQHVHWLCKYQWSRTSSSHTPYNFRHIPFSQCIIQLVIHSTMDDRTFATPYAMYEAYDSLHLSHFCLNMMDNGWVPTLLNHITWFIVVWSLDN